jgi:enamine deaminase RidA (YjgF/YER057c/UK114 family)|tara:strand:- start:1178 stop:1759 length:582 start_codon:yes stop_codon:yes gene_type:complete
MEKIKYLFLVLFLVNCTSNDRGAVDYSLMNKPLYDYDVEEKIKQLNIELPTPGEPIANYVPAVRFSETKNSMLVYVSGTGPRKENGDYLTGRLGDDMTIEEGYDAAKLTGINILASLKKEIGDLNKIKRFVKVIGMVNSTADFYQQPAVINGFSDFIVEVFGDRGKHARSAVGMVSLPSNIAVEIEVVVEVIK